MRIIMESTRTSRTVGHTTELFTSLTDPKFKRTENETQSEVSDPFCPLKIILMSTDFVIAEHPGCIQPRERLRSPQECRGKDPTLCTDLRSAVHSLEGRRTVEPSD